MNIGVEGVVRINLVPERRGGEESISPGTTDLSAEVREVRYGVRCGGADVGEDLGWEFVDWCEQVSHRSENAGGFDQAFFSTDNLIRRVSHTLNREETTGALWRTSERERLESALSHMIVSLGS